MKFLPFLLFLLSCSPKEIQVTDDIIQGEVQIAENVMKDIASIQDQNMKPKVSLVKFPPGI
jgi:hypothetical protein